MDDLGLLENGRVDDVDRQDEIELVVGTCYIVIVDVVQDGDIEQVIVEPADQVVDVVDGNEADDGIDQVIVEKPSVVVVLDFCGQLLVRDGVDVIDGGRTQQVAGDECFQEDDDVVEVGFPMDEVIEDVEHPRVHQHNLAEVEAPLLDGVVVDVVLVSQEELDDELAADEVGAEHCVEHEKAERDRLGKRQQDEDQRHDITKRRRGKDRRRRRERILVVVHVLMMVHGGSVFGHVLLGSVGTCVRGLVWCLRLQVGC